MSWHTIQMSVSVYYARCGYQKEMVFFQHNPMYMLELPQGNVDNVEHIGRFFSLSYIFSKHKQICV